MSKIKTEKDGRDRLVKLASIMLTCAYCTMGLKRIIVHRFLVNAETLVGTIGKISSLWWCGDALWRCAMPMWMALAWWRLISIEIWKPSVLRMTQVLFLKYFMQKYPQTYCMELVLSDSYDLCKANTPCEHLLDLKPIPRHNHISQCGWL